jgi:hypothetical protein
MSATAREIFLTPSFPYSQTRRSIWSGFVLQRSVSPDRVWRRINSPANMDGRLVLR